MELATHDSVASLSDLTDFRHLQPGPAPARANKSKISKNRFHSWVDRYELQSLRDGPTASGDNTFFYHRRELKPHQVAVLASRRQGLTRFDSRNTTRLATRQRWPTDCDEGRELARSAARLPSDDDRGRRPPSLERQQAFCDGATTKKRQRLTTLDADDVELDTADLYRLGLLYDDEHERGSGFDLDTIVHDEPVYKLNVRHAKRGRKPANGFEKHHYDVASLPLDLSFAALGDDETLARYLISPDEDELLATVSTPSASQARRAADSPTPLITVIHELDDDTINVDEVSSRSLHAPRESEFPDLVSDNDNDDENEDWALLKDDDDDEEDDDGEGGAAPGNPDAWIVLG